MPNNFPTVANPPRKAAIQTTYEDKAPWAVNLQPLESEGAVQNRNNSFLHATLLVLRNNSYTLLAEKQVSTVMHLRTRRLRNLFGDSLTSCCADTISLGEGAPLYANSHTRSRSK